MSGRVLSDHKYKVYFDTFSGGEIKKLFGSILSKKSLLIWNQVVDAEMEKLKKA